MPEIRFAKFVAILNGAIPLVLLGWDAWNQNLGANPVNFAIRTTGLLALIFLLLTLSVTPLARISGWNWLIHFRRTLGVYACVHAVIHFLIFFVYDRDLHVGSTLTEIFTRLYLTIGTAGLLMMLPLALTSTNAMIKRLGPTRWKLLHRLAYFAAIAGVVHYVLLVKSDLRQPLVFAALLLILLLYRLVLHYLKLSRFYVQAQRPPATAAPATLTGVALPARATKWSGQLTVAHVMQETPDVRTFRLIPQGGTSLPFDYLPGQFLTLSLTIDGQPVKRSYTIASSPSRAAYCELTIKREERGLVSRYLHEHIRPGDKLPVSAPGGRFVFTGEGADSVVLIAGGVGITPLMSKIRYLTDRGWPGQIYLIYSAKTVADVIFQEELAYLAKRHPNLHVCLTLSRVAAGEWTGEQGRITLELLRRYVPDLGKQQIHICGPTELNKSVKSLLLEAGISADLIQLESFGAAKPTELGSAAPAAMPVLAGSRESEPAPSEQFTIHFARSGKALAVPRQTTLLEAAEQLGVRIEYDCRAGICGTCKVRLLSGQVTMDSQDALDASDQAQNLILSCQAHCQEEVTVDA
jgi:glycine betaine catabolism B